MGSCRPSVAKLRGMRTCALHQTGRVRLSLCWMNRLASIRLTSRHPRSAMAPPRLAIQPLSSLPSRLLASAWLSCGSPWAAPAPMHRVGRHRHPDLRPHAPTSDPIRSPRRRNRASSSLRYSPTAGTCTADRQFAVAAQRDRVLALPHPAQRRRQLRLPRLRLRRRRFAVRRQHRRQLHHPSATSRWPASACRPPSTASPRSTGT